MFFGKFNKTNRSFTSKKQIIGMKNKIKAYLYPNNFKFT